MENTHRTAPTYRLVLINGSTALIGHRVYPMATDAVTAGEDAIAAGEATDYIVEEV